MSSSDPNATATRVALWTVPRSVSTAFERAFMQLDGAHVFHEPYGGPYYFGPERRSRRFAGEPVDPAQTYAEVTRALLAERDGVTTVFSKDMAYYVDPREVRPMMGAFRQSFLMRDPRKSVPSLHRLSVSSKRTGWTYFDGGEAGFAELHALFRVATDDLGQEPVVVDADDLLADPPAMLAAYCAAVGVPFREDMLEWKAERVPDWDVWAGWHDDAQHSTGFRRHDPGRAAAPEDAPREPPPPEVQATIDAAMPHYEALRSYRLRV